MSFDGTYEESYLFHLAAPRGNEAVDDNEGKKVTQTVVTVINDTSAAVLCVGLSSRVFRQVMLCAVFLLFIPSGE